MVCKSIRIHCGHCFKSGCRIVEVAQRVKAQDAVTHKGHCHGEPSLHFVSVPFWASLPAKCLSAELQLAKRTGLQISELNLTFPWLYTGQSLFISFQAFGLQHCLRCCPNSVTPGPSLGTIRHLNHTCQTNCFVGENGDTFGTVGNRPKSLTFPPNAFCIIKVNR